MTNYVSHDHGSISPRTPSDLVSLLSRRAAMLEDVRINEEAGQFWGRANETEKAMRHFNWASESRKEAERLTALIDELAERRGAEALS